MKRLLLFAAVLIPLIGCAARRPISVMDHADGTWSTPAEPMKVDNTPKPKAYLSVMEVATLHEGKCSLCEKEGLKSKVTLDSYGTCTAMACAPGFYDEDGKWHAPAKCNTCSFGGSCSRGHRIAILE